jgi:hypothetical protein
MHRHSRLIFIILLGVLFGALLIWSAWSVPFPHRLKTAQERWYNQHISDYELHLTINGQPHYHATYILTVRNNKIARVECNDTMGECRDYAQDFTVLGLFTEAQAQYDAQQARPSLELDIRFDPVYGFPERIEAHDLTVFDGGSIILVDHFAPLQ